MKSYFEAILLLCLLALTRATRISQPTPPKSMDSYLSSLSSEIVDKLLTKAKELPIEEIAPQPNLTPATSGVKIAQPDSKSQARQLDGYESLTNSYLMGDNDDTSTTNHLSMLISQQKAMQNYRVVGNWLNDLENNLDDLRDAVNRRVSDLATGLQRKNQLLGHYNYIGQGMGLSGQGFPNPSMNNMVL